MSRKNIFISLGVVTILSTCWYFFQQPTKKNYYEYRSAFNRPDVEKEINKHATAIERIQKEAHQRKLSRKLASEGKFEDAIREALKALDFTNKDGDDDEWMARRNLGRIYEQAGKYDLALKELEWAESIQTRPDVLIELAQDRRRLETLLKSAPSKSTEASL